jgi:hypothetical protein
MRYSLFIITAVVVALLVSCTKNCKQKGEVIADTITYEVIVQNPDPDDQWMTQCLKSFKQHSFIEEVFSQVYAGKIKAYDFFTKKPLNSGDVKKIETEPGYSRDNIGKIQFTERWYFDSSSQKFQKEVLSLVLGYSVYDQDGRLRGYKPVFKIFLNQ